MNEPVKPQVVLSIKGRKFTDVVTQWNGFIPLLLIVHLLEKVFYQGGLMKIKPCPVATVWKLVQAMPVIWNCGPRMT